MTNPPDQNEITEIFGGFMLLMAIHSIATVLIFVLGFIELMIVGLYSSGVVLIGGAMGFLFWQLLYVIPLVLRFKRRRQFGSMKGVIIGATLTALVHGACFVLVGTGF